MKKHKRVIANFLTISAMALAIPVPGVAAEEGHAKHHAQHHEMKHKRFERMAEALELSDAQREQISSIMQAHHQKMRAEREKMWNDVDKLLTAEQREKAQEMRKQRAEKAKQWMRKDG